MHFIGIEIGHGGTHAAAMDLESSAIRAGRWARHQTYQKLMSHQQYLVDTLHPAEFL